MKDCGNIAEVLIVWSVSHWSRDQRSDDRHLHIPSLCARSV